MGVQHPSHELRWQTCEEFKPLLLKAMETFGKAEVIMAAQRSPYKAYRTHTHARSSLGQFLSGKTHLSWGAMRAYDWAIQQFWPMAAPLECQTIIRTQRPYPRKTAVVLSMPVHTDNTPDLADRLTHEVEEYLARGKKPAETLGEQILRAYLARDDDAILDLTEGLQ
jgi:hypothetical protein